MYDLPVAVKTPQLLKVLLIVWIAPIVQATVPSISSVRLSRSPSAPLVFSVADEPMMVVPPPFITPPGQLRVPVIVRLVELLNTPPMVAVDNVNGIAPKLAVPLLIVKLERPATKSGI